MDTVAIEPLARPTIGSTDFYLSLFRHLGHADVRYLDDLAVHLVEGIATVPLDLTEAEQLARIRNILHARNAALAERAEAGR